MKQKAAVAEAPRGNLKQQDVLNNNPSIQNIIYVYYRRRQQHFNTNIYRV
jgi:hypothetical protein